MEPMGNTIDPRLIGESIHILRVQNHLTQEVLAEDVGYSIRNIRRIEKDGTMRLEVVNVFAEYFGIPAIDILNGCLFFFAARIMGI